MNRSMPGLPVHHQLLELTQTHVHQVGVAIQPSHPLCFPSLQFSSSVVSNLLRPHGPQLASLSCPSATPRVYPNSCPLSRWCHPTISSSVVPFSSCLWSLRHQGLFQEVSSLHQVARELEFQLHHQTFQRIFRTDFLSDWLVRSACSPRDSQESSPTP